MQQQFAAADGWKKVAKGTGYETPGSGKHRHSKERYSSPKRQISDAVTYEAAARFAEESSGLAGVRAQVMGAAQRRQQTRFRELVGAVAERYSPEELDQILALHYVAWTNCHNDVATHLIKIGCDPFAVDMNGDTVFHYAARGGNVRLLNSLYNQHGSKILARVNVYNFTLMLTAAAEAPDERAFEVLLLLEWLYFHGASIESQCSQGKSPLMWAVQRGSLTIIQWLLARGANLAHRDYMGRTVLHLACATGDNDIVRFICDKGAIAFLKTPSVDGGSISKPLDICRERGAFWLLYNLHLWNLSVKSIGTIVIVRHSYTWYFLFLSLINFFVAGAEQWQMWTMVMESDTSVNVIGATWFLGYAGAIILWFLTAFADPGFVGEDTIPNQKTKCFMNYEQVIVAPHIKPASSRTKPAENHIQQLEKETLKYSSQIMNMNKLYRSIDGYAQPPADVEARFEVLMGRQNHCRAEMSRIADVVGEERRKNVTAAYLDEVIKLAPRKVCMTCQIVKPFRSHHCGDCARCIHRFDHHCVWIDNCVGLKNQTIFLTFLCFLLFTILLTFVVFGCYCAKITAFGSSGGISGGISSGISSGISGGISSGISGGRLFDHYTDESWTMLSLFEQPLFYIGLTNQCFNIVWIGFVGYLFVRTARSMLTNVTFYESLKKPLHIQQRFTSDFTSKFWDFKGQTVASILRHILSFCTSNESYDDLDYPQVAVGVKNKPKPKHHIIELSPYIKPDGTSLEYYQPLPYNNIHDNIDGGNYGGENYGGEQLGEQINNNPKIMMNRFFGTKNYDPIPHTSDWGGTDYAGNPSEILSGVPLDLAVIGYEK